MQARLEALNQMAQELDSAHTEVLRQEHHIRQRLGLPTASPVPVRKPPSNLLLEGGTTENALAIDGAS